MERRDESSRTVGASAKDGVSQFVETPDRREDRDNRLDFFRGGEKARILFDTRATESLQIMLGREAERGEFLLHCTLSDPTNPLVDLMQKIVGYLEREMVMMGRKMAEDQQKGSGSGGFQYNLAQVVVRETVTDHLKDFLIDQVEITFALIQVLLKVFLAHDGDDGDYAAGHSFSIPVARVEAMLRGENFLDLVSCVAHASHEAKGAFIGVLQSEGPPYKKSSYGQSTLFPLDPRAFEFGVNGESEFLAVRYSHAERIRAQYDYDRTLDPFDVLRGDLLPELEQYVAALVGRVLDKQFPIPGVIAGSLDSVRKCMIEGRISKGFDPKIQAQQVALSKQFISWLVEVAIKKYLPTQLKGGE